MVRIGSCTERSTRSVLCLYLFTGHPFFFPHLLTRRFLAWECPLCKRAGQCFGIWCIPFQCGKGCSLHSQAIFTTSHQISHWNDSFRIWFSFHSLDQFIQCCSIFLSMATSTSEGINSSALLAKLAI